MRHYVRPATPLIIAGSFCVLAGCASTHTQGPDEQPEGDRIVMTDAGSTSSGQAAFTAHTEQVIHANDTYAGVTARIYGPGPTILDTLSGIYQDLGIPITTRMSTTGQIGNRSYKIPGHSLKNVPLSRIIDCGQGAIGRNRTDADEITLSVISTIRPGTDSGSVVNTFVKGFARAYASSSDPVRCASVGWLERAVNGRLAKAFGGSVD